MNIAILGSTGSIGCNALDVVNKHPKDFTVTVLSGHRNIALLARQILAFKPRIACVPDAESADELVCRLHKKINKLKILQGVDGLINVVSSSFVDTVLIAMVGSAGVYPLRAAIRAKKRIALANKESLVMAGDIVMREARARRVSIIPVDSEHSAIFQCMQASTPKDIKRIILTASGGSLYHKKIPFRKVRVQDALAHPNWKMGRKITIDSATLMNKGLEAIEAHHLFNLPMSRIHIVIHPQSIIHSLVEFMDGSMLAQLSQPDMRLPIQYALTFPARQKSMVSPLCLEDIRKLEFFRPDFKRFPCLGLALKAGRSGGTLPAVMNASNEVAVDAFLSNTIAFDRIPGIINAVMAAHRNTRLSDMRSIMSADAWAREKAAFIIRGLY